MPVIYFVVEGAVYVLIGTREEIRRDLDWRGEGDGLKWPRKARYRRHMRQVVLEMEGTEGKAHVIRARFEAYRGFPARKVHFRYEGDLRAYIEANATPWTGQHAQDLGLPKPEKPQGVPVPIRLGLRRSKPIA